MEVTLGKQVLTFPGKLHSNKFEFPKIESTNKYGKQIYWQIFVAIGNNKKLLKQ